MKNFLAIFIVCFLGCYIVAIFFLSNFLAMLAVISFLMTWGLTACLKMSDKVDDLEKRIRQLENEKESEG